MTLSKYNTRTRCGLLINAYLLILFVSIVYKDIYSYGGYIEVLLAFFALLYNTKTNNTRNITFIIILLVPIYALFRTSFIYLVGDAASALIVLTLIDISENIKLSKKEDKVFVLAMFVYFALFVILSFNPAYYDGGDDRYIGLLPSGTVSSSVLVILLIFFVEKYKMHKRKLIVFAFAVLLILMNIQLCRTRSVLFVLPYLLYTFMRVTSSKRLKYVSVLVTLIIFVYTFILISNNAETLRLSSDETSVLTRTYLYEEEYSKIKENYFLIPHGFNSCTRYIQSITSEGYSPHNSFLQYWYDWGICWIIYLVVVVKRLRTFCSKYKCKMQMILIMIFVASCALHNVLLYSYIWIPLMLIFNQFKSQYLYEK